jgi:hypothetical protein
MVQVFMCMAMIVGMIMRMTVLVGMGHVFFGGNFLPKLGKFENPVYFLNPWLIIYDIPSFNDDN